MYTQVISNPNEVTKGEFDKLNKEESFDLFTPQQVSIVASELASLIKKAETSELTAEETDLIKSGTIELKNLTKYTINEMVSGRIVKNDVYTQPKQVKWEETLEKSENGANIIKGVFLDTPLNQELNRVGVVFEKGKKIVKEDEEVKEDEKDDGDSEMFKNIRSSIKKGMDKKAIFKAMTENEETDKEEVKKCLKKAYEAEADEMKKAAEDDFEDDVEKEEDKEETEKSKKKT